MPSPASIKNHPIHPMLVAIPIGLFVFSFVSDILFLSGAGDSAWSIVAYRAIFGGVIGALLAAIAGFIDFLSITDPKTKRTGTQHMIANLIVVGLFVVNLLLRSTDATGTSPVPYVLSFVALCILGFAGWKGWDMVYEHGMGVGLTKDGHLEKDRPRPYGEKPDADNGAEEREQIHEEVRRH